ncbi:putative serine/threonine-protein kinase PBL1 isoform X2 [Tasmannia lanceolata]|uniref:putative serine/threonine-protein kinase PBL1 isoform X2 n=1 Tax=Tasmannia lanceolata TaxID=3420 RepID=UPI0040638E5E
MAKAILLFQKWLQREYSIPTHALIFIFTFVTIVGIAASQPSMSGCSLSFDTSSFGNISGCEGGNWGGFLSRNCCGIALETYLYALGQRAKQTGQIYLNATEQRNCLDLMKKYDDDILDCGIERLTSGGGGCSDFTVRDVTDKLAKGLGSLGDNCNFVSSMGEQNSMCNVCYAKWGEIRGSIIYNGELVQINTEVCRFAVLVSLTSSKIDDLKWANAVYRCLGEHNPSEDRQQSRRESFKISTGLWLLVGGLVGIFILVIIVVWAVWHSTKKWSISSIPQEKDDSKELVSEGSGCQKIPIKEIYAATNDLNALNFIGQGIAGKVYKGVLSKGQHVAVKHIIKDEYVETFVREVTSLSHVRHPNLVTLLGYCDEEDECFLVYELCSNGNLSEWLFGKDKVLPWIKRLEIAIDCAQGLWFLHTYPEGCIVHRDIKPTNILLGDHFEAKLSDFGLSKVMDLGQSYVSSEVRGTFGYVDPEYQRNHRVNPSGDVYSFGIVLLQILSGKRVIDMNVKRPMSLDRMAKVLTKGGSISEFADPKLNGEYSLEAFERTLKLALSCTAHKQQRPSMEQIVIKLTEVLDISRFSTSGATNHLGLSP